MEKCLGSGSALVGGAIEEDLSMCKLMPDSHRFFSTISFGYRSNKALNRMPMVAVDGQSDRLL